MRELLTDDRGMKDSVSDHRELRLGPNGGDAAAWVELQRANQELEAFSYSVAHDLRAPLRVVHILSQTLLEDYVHVLDGDGRHLIERIHVNVQRMSEILEDLLTLSQVTQGVLHREIVDVTELAHRIVAALHVRDPARVVEVQIAEHLTVRCDGRLVAIALENLFANAWKFTSKRARAHIVFDRDACDVFRIRDNGVGFDMERGCPRFEPFGRLHDDSEFEGTGIGLAIVRRVIERHGGTVWAHGVIDAGATFCFTLCGEAP